MTTRPAVMVLAILFCALVGSGEARAKTTCPNGEVNKGEDCDTLGESATCDDDCTLVDCGDVNVNQAAGETCDDGNTADGDGCSSTCQLTCGNGTVDAGEECDTSGESATCDDDCTQPACGDDNVNQAAAEACDDGNTADGDECSGDCSQIAVAVPLPITPQSCVNAVNRNLAGVAKAQAADTTACLKSAARQDGPFTACFGTDRTGKVAKAKAKTTATFASTKCTRDNTPTFAFTTATAVNDAGEVETNDGTRFVFGSAPTIALKSDKAASGCQAEALKHYNAILDKWLAEANKAKKRALKGGKGGTPAAAASGVQLAAAIDAALDDNAQVAKAVAKASTGLTKKCTFFIVDASFDCGGAITVEALRLCIAGASQAAACEAFEAADGIDLDCPTP